MVCSHSSLPLIGLVLAPVFWFIHNIWLFMTWGMAMAEPSSIEEYIAFMFFLFLVTLICVGCARSGWWIDVRQRLGDKRTKD